MKLKEKIKPYIAMHTLNIKIEPEQYEKLRKTAYETKKSIAQIVRELIDGMDS